MRKVGAFGLTFQIFLVRFIPPYNTFSAPGTSDGVCMRADTKSQDPQRQKRNFYYKKFPYWFPETTLYRMQENNYYK